MDQNSKEFKNLQKIWYAKLAKDGFDDQEKIVGNESKLKQNSANVYRQASQTEIEAKEIYFKSVSDKVNDLRTEFDSIIDKMIMACVSKGMFISETCKYLKDKGKSRNRETVRLIIRKYEDLWKIRSWKPDQLKHKSKKVRTL
jgi:hypothetical protein